MIIDNIKSVAENMVERFKSPFGGTLIATWTIYNWKLVFSLFNFDAKHKLDDKIKIISDYINVTDYWTLAWHPIIAAFIAIFSFQLLSLLASAIIILFAKWGKPTILWIVDRNKIIDKESFNQLKTELQEIQKKYEGAKDESSKYQSENEKVRGDKANLMVTHAELNNIHKKIIEENEAFKREKRQIEGELLESKSLVEKLKQEIKDAEGLIMVLNDEMRVENASVIFDGVWVNKYTLDNGTGGEEEFEIIDNNYIINGKAVFKIKDVQYDEKNKNLRFNKLGLKDKKSHINNLVSISDKHFIGTENNTTKIEYYKKVFIDKQSLDISNKSGIELVPDVNTNLLDGEIGEDYSQSVTLSIPSDLTTNFPGVGVVTVHINYLTINTIEGLPDGLKYFFEPESGRFSGNTSGRFIIYGNSKSKGIYPLLIRFTLNVTHVLLGTFDAPQSVIEGYRVIIKGN